MAEGYELLSDLFKDANGFRPGRNYTDWFNGLNEEQKAKEWDYLCQTLEDNERAKEARQLEAIAAWEAHIANLMATGAGTKGNALRWDMEAMDVDGDVGYYCWKWDIPYSKEPELKELLAA